jgi:alanyl-tRNA synthetase
VAAGIRRIEAVTGRKAYELIQSRFDKLNQAANFLGTTSDGVPEKVTHIIDELNNLQKQVASMRQSQVASEFIQKLEQTTLIDGVRMISTRLNDADADTLRQMVDRYRQKYPSKSVAVLASAKEGRPVIIAAVSSDLIDQGLDAIELVRFVAAPLGGGGGGKPTLAQAGGKDASKLDAALAGVEDWLRDRLNA